MWDWQLVPVVDQLPVPHQDPLEVLLPVQLLDLLEAQRLPLVQDLQMYLLPLQLQLLVGDQLLLQLLALLMNQLHRHRPGLLVVPQHLHRLKRGFPCSTRRATPSPGLRPT